MRQIIEYLLGKGINDNVKHDSLTIGDIIQYDFSNIGSYYIIMKFDSKYDDVIYTLNLIGSAYSTKVDPDELTKGIQWERYAENMSYGYGFIHKIKDIVGHYDIPKDIIKLYEKAPEYYQKIKEGK